MNMRNLTIDELRATAEYAVDFDRMQAARREVVRRFLNCKPLATNDEISDAQTAGESDDYSLGYEEGYSEAKDKYAL